MEKAIWRHFDLPMLLAIVLLLLVGMLMIYSSYEATAPSAESWWDNSVWHQGALGLAGLILYMITTAIDYHVWASLWRWIYLFIVGILGVTWLLGSTSFGAQSWLEIARVGGVQPSELAKILMILVLAKQLGRNYKELESGWPFVLSLLLLILPVIAIYMQPDFGTAVILVIAWVGMVFLAGVRWRHLALVGLAAAVAAPIIWFRLQDYMRDRILMFVLPGYDPTGSSYNINQALVSIGSGGWWGKGFLQGTQSQLHFLRVRHTDFVFSVLAEEFGFVGSIVALLLFAFIVLRLLRVVRLARDPYGRIIAAGVTTMFLAQTIINLGMNANILPVTGLPLPLVSYGGSSLIATLVALGLAQSVLVRHREAELELR